MSRYNALPTARRDRKYSSPQRENMRKLALSDEILLKIEKPAHYIGNEVNSVNKDISKVDVRFAMCFPDVNVHMFPYNAI